MKLRQLFETEKKTAVVAFGRMNPLTIGHEKLVDTIKSQQGDHYLFLSQTQKPKDNPLPFNIKLQFAKAAFPGINVGHESVRTPIQMLQMLEKLGYTDVIYVAGSDRVEQFNKLFNDYNGKEYNFNSIEIIGAGERDPDADGAEGMSASKMRAAAAAGEKEAFTQGLPKRIQKDWENVYSAVRTGMGIKELEPVEGVAEGDLDEGVGNIVAAFAVAGGLLLGGNVAYQDSKLAQQWMQSYEQIKDSDPDKADRVKKLVNQYKHTSFKNAGTRSMTKQQIEKIIADFNSQSVQEQGVAEEAELDEGPGYKVRADGILVKEGDLVLNKSSLVNYMRDKIIEFVQKEDDVDKLSELLVKIAGKTVKNRGGKFYTISDEDIQMAFEAACKNGMYYCSTDKKMKCRQGPKKRRG